MLSHAANIAVPIWRGTYCFLQCFFFCMCSLSIPLSFLFFLLSPCSPAPLAPPHALSHRWHFYCPQNDSGGKTCLKKGCENWSWCWRREGGKCMACHLLSWCPLCPKLHWSMQRTRGRAQTPGLSVPHPPWWNSCCTTSCLQLGDTCPLVNSSDYFPQQQGQVHFGSFPISLWKCKLWVGRDIVLLFHWVMQIPIPCKEWMNK